jgi:hypothetical protein
MPVDVAHAIDLDVIDSLGDQLLRQAGVVVMPWFPHVPDERRPGWVPRRAIRVSERPLDAIAADHPVQTALLHYTDVHRQPWVSTDHPLGYLWMRELFAALDAGHVRRSLMAQVRERIEDPMLLLPARVRRQDPFFVEPFRVRSSTSTRAGSRRSPRSCSWRRRARAWRRRSCTGSGRELVEAVAGYARLYLLLGRGLVRAVGRSRRMPSSHSGAPDRALI